MAYALPTLNCLRCGHEWVPRVPRITMCPRCKSLLWNKPKESKAEVERKRAATRKRS